MTERNNEIPLSVCVVATKLINCELKKNSYFWGSIFHEHLYIFIPKPINNFKILLKSSHNIESVLLFFNFSVTQDISQPYSIHSVSSDFRTYASKGRFKTRKSHDGCKYNSNKLTKRKKISVLWTTEITMWFFDSWQNDRSMLWGHNPDNYFLNLSWNILQLQQPVHRLKIENLMSQCTNERTQTTIKQPWKLLFESYLQTFMHRICRLQHEQPVCRFKAKTLISSLRKQPVFWLRTKCFDIKGNLYNQFFIITSTDFWTFSTFHPSLHDSIADSPTPQGQEIFWDSIHDFIGFMLWFLRKWAPVCGNWS